jgi:hypothetical protein
MRVREKWAAALSGRDQSEVDRIENGASWFSVNTRRGRHIVLSLKTDRFLPVRAMRRIQDILASSANSGDAKTSDDYKLLCYSHVLRGGSVRTPTPPIFGRAIEEEALLDAMLPANHPRIPVDKLRSLVGRLVAGTMTRADMRALPSIKMAPFGIWVTWDRASGGANDPFAFSSARCADEIRASLGLSTLAVGHPILLITYSSAGVPQALRPTCADAGLYLRFEPPPAPPPPANDAFGLTKPWEEIPGLPEAIFERLDVAPRPEAVHGSITVPRGIRISIRPSQVIP